MLAPCPVVIIVDVREYVRDNMPIEVLAAVETRAWAEMDITEVLAAVETRAWAEV